MAGVDPTAVDPPPDATSAFTGAISSFGMLGMRTANLDLDDASKDPARRRSNVSPDSATRVLPPDREPDADQSAYISSCTMIPSCASWPTKNAAVRHG